MRICSLILCLLVVGCSTQRPDHYTEYVKNISDIEAVSTVELNVPEGGPISFYGAVDYDKLNAGQLGMLYPAATAGVFVASVLTHAVIAESSKDGVKSEQQATADKVLAPYQDQIRFIFPFDLKKSAEEQLNATTSLIKIGKATAGATSWVLVSNPVYFMAADERSIAIVNKVTIYKNGRVDAPIYQNMVEAVSDPAPEKSPQSYWMDNVNPAFQSTVKQLFNRSIELAIRDASNSLNDENVPDSTIRYSRSGKNSVERGKLLETECGHITIRTLRGWIKWVPAADGEITSRDKCNPPS